MTTLYSTSDFFNPHHVDHGRTTYQLQGIVLTYNGIIQAKFSWFNPNEYSSNAYHGDIVIKNKTVKRSEYKPEDKTSNQLIRAKKYGEYVYYLYIPMSNLPWNETPEVRKETYHCDTSSSTTRTYSCANGEYFYKTNEQFKLPIQERNIELGEELAKLNSKNIYLSDLLELAPFIIKNIDEIKSIDKHLEMLNA